MPAVGCKAERQQDEYYCATCHLRWAVDDPEPPPCGQGWLSQDKVALFAAVRILEQQYTKITRYMTKGVREEYRKWEENYYGNQDGEGTECGGQLSLEDMSRIRPDA